MLLRRLKSNNAFNLVFIPIVAIAFWAKSLLNPFIYDYTACENTNVLFAPVVKLLGTNAFLHSLVSLVLVIALGFLMQAINARYAFIRIRSKLPGVLFVIVLSGFLELHTLHPVYFGALFVLFAISRAFSMFEKARPYSAVFDVGFLLGVASLFCFNLVILFPAFLLSVFLLSRETKWRELLIIILGFLLPFVFAVSYAFVTDKLPQTLTAFSQSLTVVVNHLKDNLVLQAYLAVLIFYTLIASLDILKQYDKKKISSRKYFTVFFWLFVFSLIGFVFVPAISQEMLVISAIPVTFLISNFFVFMKRKVWGELLFGVFVLVVIALQFSEFILNG